MKQRCNVQIVERFSRKLIELNQELIEANIEDIKKEAVKEFEKELSKVLKKWR